MSPWVQSRIRKEVAASSSFRSQFALLGVASLLLGAAGLFSVISYIAGQRNREFAVRIALGATQSNVLNLVMKDAPGDGGLEQHACGRRGTLACGRVPALEQDVGRVLLLMRRH